MEMGERNPNETPREPSRPQAVLLEAISGKESFTIFTILTSGCRILISYSALAASRNSPHESHNLNVPKVGPNTGFEVVGQRSTLGGCIPMFKALINLLSTDFNSNSSNLIICSRNSENVAGSRWTPLIARVRRREGKPCLSLPGRGGDKESWAAGGEEREIGVR